MPEAVLALPPLKTCASCGEAKDPVAGFYVTRHGRPRPSCRKCQNAAAHARKKLQPDYRERERVKARRLYEAATARRYGMTVEQLRACPQECEVCGSTDRLAYDHDHATGAYRGRLCSPCNLAIGQASDDPARLRALAAYLEAKIP